MAINKPSHPGHSIRQNCLDPFGLNITEAARILDVSRHTLSRLLNGHSAVTAEMAIRLEKAGWSNAEFWLFRANKTSHSSGWFEVVTIRESLK
ncbi:MAG: HigA family addiction module antitoxin [candidate division Zixibacteria bacterium]|nr:HigA family addiction module antitoxin [candidate division Zixibacteria bacterium]